jgi:hypothetical protein
LAVHLRGALVHLGLVLALAALLSGHGRVRRLLGLRAPLPRAALTLTGPASALDPILVQMSVGHCVLPIGLPA